jgi:hypothetical protein
MLPCLKQSLVEEVVMGQVPLFPELEKQEPRIETDKKTRIELVRLMSVFICEIYQQSKESTDE